MTELEMLETKFSDALNYVEMARSKLASIPEKYFEGEDRSTLLGDLSSVFDHIEDQMYSIVAPMQMEEDEREQEIALLEKKLAELKGQRK